jgi:hypothetical protein
MVTGTTPRLDRSFERREQVVETLGKGLTMCLNCGCMRAHDDMGKPGVNITYEDVKRAAEANGKTVEETLETISRTADKDRIDHAAEYGQAN